MQLEICKQNDVYWSNVGGENKTKQQQQQKNVYDASVNYALCSGGGEVDRAQRKVKRHFCRPPVSEWMIILEEECSHTCERQDLRHPNLLLNFPWLRAVHQPHLSSTGDTDTSGVWMRGALPTLCENVHLKSCIKFPRSS